MNIKSLLQKSIIELRNSGIPTPEVDVKVLLLCAMKENSAFIYSHPEFLITNSQYSKFRRYIRKRKAGEPIAYIIGHKEFYGYDFFVNKNVLVPRPESEWLVEESLNIIKKRTINITVIASLEHKPAMFYFRNRIRKSIRETHPYSIIDVGTGSGSLIISLNKELKKLKPNLGLKYLGLDNSSRAVAIAKKNARELKAQNIKFLNSNLFSNRRIKNKKFDLLIANLPYVPHALNNLTTCLPAGTVKQFNNPISFEPQDAIFAKDNGSAIIKDFLIEAKNYTKTGSTILIELDPRNAKKILQFSQLHYPTAKSDLQKDLAGHNRYLIIKI